jgi:hypothetical protein
MLPRIMLRRADVAGMSCLDIGTMEDLVPALLRRAAPGAFSRWTPQPLRRQDGGRPIVLEQAVAERPHVLPAAQPSDSHTLMLAAES